MLVSGNIGSITDKVPSKKSVTCKYSGIYKWNETLFNLICWKAIIIFDTSNLMSTSDLAKIEEKSRYWTGSDIPVDKHDFLKVNEKLAIIMSNKHIYYIYYHEKTVIKEIFNQFQGYVNVFLVGSTFGKVQMFGDYKRYSGIENIGVLTFDIPKCVTGKTIEISGREESEGLIESLLLSAESDINKEDLVLIILGMPSTDFKLKSKINYYDIEYTSIPAMGYEGRRYQYGLLISVETDQEEWSSYLKYIILKKFDFGSSGETFSYPTNEICFLRFATTGAEPDPEAEIQCHDNCKTCVEEGNNIDTKCTECKNEYSFAENGTHCVNESYGYFWENGVFKKCSIGCKECDRPGEEKSTNCKYCADGFFIKRKEEELWNCVDYVEEGYFVDNGELKKCYQTCASCNGLGSDENHHCDLCWRGHYKQELTQNCLDKQPVDFYLEDNHYHKCFETCLSCDAGGNTSDNNCTKCVKGHLFMGGTKNCIEKPEDMYWDEATESYLKCYDPCQSCDDGFESVNNIHNCKTCRSGYFQIYETLNCGQGDLPGYYLDNDISKYLKCYSNCATCLGSGDKSNNNCSTCAEGYRNYEEYNPKNCIAKNENKFFIDDNLNLHFLKSEDNCPENYSYWITINNQCVSSCITATNCEICKNWIPFYITKSTCVSNCPIGTKLWQDSNYCEETIPGISFTEDENSTDFHFTVITNKREFNTKWDDIVKLSIDLMTPLDSVDENTINNITVFKSADFYYTVYPDNQPEKNSEYNLPIIHLGDCIKTLRELYSIPSEEKWFIGQLSMTSTENSKTQSNDIIIHSAVGKVEYNVYTSSDKKLDVSVCDSLPVLISYPINRDTHGWNLKEAEKYFDQGINVFDKFDPIFNDICTKMTIDGKDLTLSNRLDMVYQKVSFCENHCTLKSIDYNTYYANCECKEEKKTSTIQSLIEENEMLITFYSLWATTNLKWFKCFHTIPWNFSPSTHYGFIITLVINLIIGVLGIFYFVFYASKINAFINKHWNNPVKRTNTNRHYDNQEYKVNHMDNSNRQRTSISKKMNIISLTDKDDMSSNHIILTSLKQNSSLKYRISTKKNEKINTSRNNRVINNHQIPEFYPQELNEMNYQDAIANDKRNLCQYFFNIICEKQILFATIFNGSIFNPLLLRWMLFSFTMLCFFFFTAMFFTEDFITERYNSKDSGIIYILKNEWSKSVYASIIVIFIDKMVMIISSVNMKFEQLFKEEPGESRNHKICLLFNEMKLQVRVIYGIIIFLEFVFWYFITIFCVLYPNNQISWILSSFITIVFNFVICCVWCGMITCGRIISLRVKVK